MPPSPGWGGPRQAAPFPWVVTEDDRIDARLMSRAKNDDDQNAQRCMAVGPSLPHTGPPTAITTMSIGRCLRLRVGRGSERDSKKGPMESTFTHWVAMYYTPAGDGRRRRAIDAHATGRAPLQAKVYHSGVASARPRSLPIYARWPCPSSLTHREEGGVTASDLYEDTEGLRRP